MVKYLLIALSLFLLTCENNNNNDEDSNVNESFVIVSLQDTDAVAIVGANNLEIEQQVSIDLNSTDCSEFLNEMD